MKKIINRIKEFIKVFTEPVKEELTLSELAVVAGIGEKELDMLKQSQGGVKWKFADEYEDAKKAKKSNVTLPENQVQTVKRINTTERDSGIERD